MRDDDHEQEFRNFLKDVERSGPTSRRLSRGTLYDAPRAAMEHVWTHIVPENEAEQVENLRRIRAAEKRHKRSRTLPLD